MCIGSLGKSLTRTLHRKALSRWTGRTQETWQLTLVVFAQYLCVCCLFVYMIGVLFIVVYVGFVLVYGN